jgi:hypothetical protein
MTMQTEIAKLDKVAGSSGRGVIQLPTGSVILDRSDPDAWRLAIGMDGVWPCIADCVEIARCAGVPAEIKRAFEKKKSWHWVVYRWTPEGNPAPAQPAIQPPLDLELAPIREIAVADDAPIEERFREFHLANPQVYYALHDLAMRLARQGRRRIGVKMLWETLRYSYSFATDGDEYKLNNVFTSRYARLLMDQEPELRGLIETRALRA